MVEMTSPDKGSYRPDTPDGTGRKRKSIAPQWVQPSLLLGLALVLVAITTVVVALRGPSRRSRSEAQKPVTAMRNSGPTALPSTGGPLPGTSIVGGRPDRDEAQAFHAKFVEGLAPRLRTIGFRPELLTRTPGRPDSADRWSVRVPSNFPILRVNAEVTFLARHTGGAVYRAEQDSLDLALVRLWVGAGNVITDEVNLRTDKKRKFKGAIAFVIDDVGYRPVSGTKEFIELPYALTFAILPHHESGVEVAEKAIAAGKQVIVHLPMEPNGDGVSLERNTISASMTDEEIRRYTTQHIESLPGVSGVNNHMGSKATEDQRVMRNVLTVLKERGLYFLDSRTSPNTVGERTAQEMNVRTGSRTVFLDNERETSKVVQEILRTAAIAARGKNAIAIGHDRTETYRALIQTLPRLEAEGFRICFLSDLLR